MKDYIEIEGRKLRVQFNWRAASAFLSAKKAENLAPLAHIMPEDYTLLMACAINEGERLEGREIDITADKLDDMPPCVITEFLAIFGRQNRPDLPEEKAKKK